MATRGWGTANALPGLAEGRVLGEHPGLQRAELWPRIDPEILGQYLSCPLEGPQSIGLPPGPVETRHQQTPKPLAERVLGHQPFQLGYGVVMPSDLELSSARALQSD